MSRQRYYTSYEVSQHNDQKDIWVSYLGRVYDLTTLCSQHQGDVLMKPIISAAGTDISHWFDKKTLDIRKHVDEETGCVFPYTPMGRFLHIPPKRPVSNWKNNFGMPWWKEEKYCIGHLSAKTRHIRLINTLTSQEHTIEVCQEETMEEILRRYLVINAHAASYTWKFCGKELDMKKTLEENGVLDEDEDFYKLSMDEEQWRPAIHLYFSDDLTVG